MSCFGITSKRRRRKASWWWCKNLTATISSGLLGLRRARAVRWAVPGRARRVQRDHRSFAPVYIDELYNQQARSTHVEHVEPCTSTSTTTSTGRGKAYGTDGISMSSSTTSPSASILSVVKGMGEVDLRAEMFIRKFREEMRLQSQRSAQEYQEMLARGL